MMMTRILFMALGLLAGTVSTGCENTPDEKIQDAKKNLQEAKHDVKEAVNDALTAYRDEWESFRFDAEAKLRDNEYTINGHIKKMVKADPTQKAIFNKRIGELEQRNGELQKRLAEYHDDGKSNWEEFKQGFVHDLDALGTSLKGFSVHDKK